MILSADHPGYGDLPGIWTLLGGLWVLHFSYWGFNQYIIQRALGAENLAEAQKGLAFAAFLKLLIPVIVVVPGIAAVLLAQDGLLNGSVIAGSTDRTYGELIKLAPVGVRGLVFAALIAAIVSSLASMINSIATIFTMDIYRDYLAEGRGEKHYVMVGRLVALSAMAIALMLARPFLGAWKARSRQYRSIPASLRPGSLPYSCSVSFSRVPINRGRLRC